MLQMVVGPPNKEIGESIWVAELTNDLCELNGRAHSTQPAFSGTHITL
jgi:hypothetical protein